MPQVPRMYLISIIELSLTVPDKRNRRDAKNAMDVDVVDVVDVGCASRLRLAHAIFAVAERPGFRVQAADGQHTLLKTFIYSKVVAPRLVASELFLA